MNEKIKQLVLQKGPSDDIKRSAMQHRMRTLRQSGWLKVLAGVTTPDEILRVTQADEVIEQTAPMPAAPPTIPPNAVPAVALPEPQASLPLDAAAEAEAERQQSYRDRRVFERLSDNVYVRYKIFKTQARSSASAAGYEPELVGLSKNISAGGILFRAAENLPKATILDLLIELPNEAAVQCLARVVRCSERVANKEYEVAVCFLDLPNADRSRLNRYVLRNEEKAG